jgi:carboxypeptidase T
MKEKTLSVLLAVILILISTIYPVMGTSYTNQHFNNTSMMPHEYFTYPEMTDLLHALQENYSDIMLLESIGMTYEGRNIWMVKLSDNVNEDEYEPGVLLMGAHHGNEKPSFEALIFFIQHMLENYEKENTDDDNDGTTNEDPIDGNDNDNDGIVDEDPSEDRVRDAINNTQIFLIPMVNPDGVEYIDGRNNGWRKNRALKEGQTENIGVDLNRNYAYKWELYDIFPTLYGDFWTSDPESWNYRGEHPFSENETTAVKNFVESEIINISLSYHSYGEFIIYPWMHTSQYTPDEDLFISVGEGIASISKYDFYQGKGTLVPWPGGTIGTSENWLYGERKILSFTIELCETRGPTNPSVVYEYCLVHVGVNLYVCERAQDIQVEKKIVTNPYSLMSLRLLSMFQNTGLHL